MNLRHLRTFVSIADAGGIARAGSRLNLSQPAASRQILALEADLGVRLFDRIGRRFRLTSEGEDLLRQSRRLLMDADSLGARARALKGGHTGILRVGATPMVVAASSAARSRPTINELPSRVPAGMSQVWFSVSCIRSRRSSVA